jgi:hypothetical protein
MARLPVLTMEGAYMKHCLFGRRALILSVVTAAVAFVPAAAQAKSAANSGDPAGCPAVDISQPFAAWGDANWYMQVPGQDDTGFTGAGWVLTGGAKIVRTTLSDGSSGLVLDLPSGATATSPTFCVTSDDPDARTMARTTAGSGGLSMTVTYNGGKSKNTGNLKASGSTWSPTATADLHTTPVSGGVPAQLTLSSSGKGSEEQVYDLFVDPRCGR